MFTMTIDTDNAAFEEDPGFELARLLKLVAHRVEEGERYGSLYDANGNYVGEYRVKAAER
jgi:hypothetical protein